jgi:uncharacterized protein (DUF1800 family)
MIQRLRHTGSFGTSRSLLQAREFLYPMQTRATLPVWRLRPLPQTPMLDGEEREARRVLTALQSTESNNGMDKSRDMRGFDFVSSVEALRTERSAQAQVIDTANMSVTNIAPTVALPNRTTQLSVNTRRQRKDKRSRTIWTTLLWLGLLNLLVVLLVAANAANAQSPTNRNGTTAKLHAMAKVVGNATPMYRLYSPELGGHVYTNRTEGYSQLVTIGWRPEGSTFRVLDIQGSIDGVQAVPLIRLWNPTIGRHVMTTDNNEAAQFAAAGWTNEGARGYVIPTQTANTVPLFRMYSPYFNSYLYLNNVKDRDAIAAAGWSYQRVIGYTLPMAPFAVDNKDAARLITQATFGINAMEQRRISAQGVEGWIEDQLLRPAASHMAYINAAKARRGVEEGKPHYHEEDSYEAIWQQWLWGHDQLRARMSFALSEIMVISNTAPDIYPDAMSTYMDTLNKHAFGTYRELLEAVTLNPAMGYYLNMMGSEKEDLAKKKYPNENYAREVLQLFSVGLYMLNPDGTRKLDSAGKPISSYDEDTVKGFAAAFTGWNFAGNNNADDKRFDRPEENWTLPLIPWATRHSAGTKKLLNGVTIPAGGTVQTDMKAALDNIANHPNVGPFIGKQLIQRFVTSNPSPAYVGRVSAVFDNNGRGVRGDLAAVIKAILLDPEARDTAKELDPKWGKQREPVIRFANVLRAFESTSRNGRNRIHYLDSSDGALGQSPLLAPSVFNFFSPFYTRAGRLAAAGLVAPEFQITNEIQTIGTANFFNDLIRNEGYGSGDTKVRMDLSVAKGIANDAVKLVDYLAALFSHGELTPSTRQIVLDTVNAMPIKGNNGAGSTSERTARVRTALTLIVLSPDFVIQK